MVFPMIIGALAAAGSAITSAVATIGTAVSSFVATVGPTLAATLETLKPYMEIVSKFANVLLQNLSILKPGEKIEDLGERALQAGGQGIKLEQFENFDEYMTALRKFELDPELSTQRSTAEKIVAGLGIATVGVEDKFSAERGSLNGLWLLPIANSQYFTPERMEGLISVGRLGSDVLAYLDKNLSGGQAQRFEESLEVGSRGTPPDKAELNTLYEALDSARETWAAISQQVEANSQKA